MTHSSFGTTIPLSFFYVRNGKQTCSLGVDLHKFIVYTFVVSTVKFTETTRGYKSKQRGEDTLYLSINKHTVKNRNNKNKKSVRSNSNRSVY